MQKTDAASQGRVAVDDSVSFLGGEPMHSVTKFSAVGLLAGALALGGCASTSDLQKAQASADQAQSEVQALNAKFDSMVAEEQAERTHASNMHKHHAMSGHHHKRHHRHH